MRLVFLYGPPGVGKLTIGAELAALTGFRLFHNHLSVDLVASVFTRDSDAWGRLLRKIRRDVFAEAARAGVDLIFTYAGRTDPQLDGIREYMEPIQANGGTVLFVQLLCAREELIARVQTDSRRAGGKLTDPNAVLERYNLALALPFEPHLQLDTTHLSAREAARRIAAHYALPLQVDDGV